MPQYLLSLCSPGADATPPSPEALEGVMREISVLNDEIKAAGGWIFAGGLHDANTATTLRLHGDEVLMTDGPFAEGKEHIGGISIVRASDLDVALGWGRELARITGLPIEVRPFQEEH
jgi:hypothetical protein